MIERRVSSNREYVVVHEDTSYFILNSAAFYSSELHRFWAQISFVAVKPAEWKLAVSTGIANWEESLKKKQDQKETQHQRQKGKEAAKKDGNNTQKKTLTMLKVARKGKLIDLKSSSSSLNSFILLSLEFGLHSESFL